MLTCRECSQEFQKLTSEKARFPKVCKKCYGKLNKRYYYKNPEVRAKHKANFFM